MLETSMTLGNSHSSKPGLRRGLIHSFVRSQSARRTRIARGSTAILALIFSLSSGCSAIINVEEAQCQTDADCGQLGPEFMNSVCQAQVCVPSSSSQLECEDPIQSSDTIKYTFTPKYATPQESPAPFTVMACERLDATCTKPVAELEGVVAGELQELTLPWGFSGFFRYENPKTHTALHFLGRPLKQDTRGWDLTIADDTTVAVLGISTNTTIDPALGTMIVIARDCEGRPLEHFKFTNATGGTPFFIVDNFPTPDATETTEQGSGGFVNVKLGTTVVSAQNASGAMLDGTQAILKPIGERWVSYVEIFP
ncbi:MAG TPA: hypothetical protein VFQ61_14950 [Polyangiaceae bacterium]|nr:hypothetical protein [Polyangiaceae bacterium]